MSWWQKKLLRYGLRYVLSKSGFLDEAALDLDNLDITIGRRNVIELKDVAINIAKISKLAQLPPSVHLETARIVLLRLVIPADFYKSSIVVDIDGVDVAVTLQEEETADSQPQREPRSGSPQHRKMNRRLHSLPQYDPGGLRDRSETLHIPTTEEVAKSFLREEPAQERKELEASVAANVNTIDESFDSESSESDTGIGVGVGLPGFLSSFLQGLIDRLKVEVRNVQIKIETDVSREGEESVPVTLQLSLGRADLDDLPQAAGAQPDDSRRRTVGLHDISVNIFSSNSIIAELSEMPSRSSSFVSQSSAQGGHSGEAACTGGNKRGALSASATNSTARSIDEIIQPTMPAALPPPPLMYNSIATVDADRFADARDEEEDALLRSSEFAIRPGDDNASWGSRRGHAGAATEDLWKSETSEGDLPASLIIQPDRVSTPRAHPSRGSSPFAMRQRRTVSPHHRSIRSPGSWPRPDESPDRENLHRSPGSWPTLDHSHYSTFEPPSGTSPVAFDNMTDNKRSAIDATEASELPPISPPYQVQDVASEEMLESRVFSHEEAQSMYMSAMTTNPASAMPGGWGSDTQSERSLSPSTTNIRPRDDSPTLDDIIPPAENRHRSVSLPSGNDTPRAHTPTPSFAPPTTTQGPVTQTGRELVFLDSLLISFPMSGTHAEEDESHEVSVKSSPRFANTASRLPGSFSAYSEISSSRHRTSTAESGDANSVLWSPQGVFEASERLGFKVAIGNLAVQLDIATGRLLYHVSSRISSALPISPNNNAKEYTDEIRTTTRTPPITVRVETLNVALKEQIVAGSTLKDRAPSGDATMAIICEQIDLHVASSSSLRLGAFGVRIGHKDFLSFRHDTATAPPQTDHSSVIAVDSGSHRFAVNNRPVTDVTINTTTIDLTLDMTSIDETFGSLGGLSGILEAGSSILSDSRTSSPVTTKPTKGVRFVEEAEDSSRGPELKLNARIGGMTATLRGSSCTASLRTSKAKVVYREQGTVINLDHVKLSGPHLGNDFTNAPISVDVASLRIDYLVTPMDKDLERLIALLTPSKDKYDNDDDILIDILLRQRRKGALLRTNFGDVKVRIDNWECISTLTDLGSDLSKLSAVTKYLPEDDKPGLLTLIIVKEAEVEMPVSERFRRLQVAMQDFHLAHVGLPALFACSVGNFSAAQVDGPDLLHPLLPLTGAESLPMVMARMLGDEEEPTIKVKLFNLCAEYSVPVILALTGMHEEVDQEEFVNAMTQSVANLAVFEHTLERSPGSDLSKTSTKRTTVELLIHDSAISLTPQNLSSKALLVFYDSHFSTKVPPEASMTAELELRTASLLLTDHVLDKPLDAPPSRRSLTENASSLRRIDQSLTRYGFVNVASVMSATINIGVEESPQLDSQKVEVRVRNDLLLLETCADSTQTLMATFAALVPPNPPSKIPKYLNEPMIPIEDLVSSFSDDTHLVSEAPPEVLYDVDEDPREYVADIPMEGSVLEEPDDFLAESAIMGSVDGPASAVFGTELDNDVDSLAGDHYPETAESLLEEDPFEMTDLDDVHLGDAALMRDLARQCRPAVNAGPADLGLYEIEDLGYDALGSGQQALGQQHRFNNPSIGGHGRRATKASQDLPFKLFLRDLHVIWHLHDGYDWQHTRDGIVEAVEQVEQKAEERRARRRQSLNDREDEESVIGDFLFNSIYIGIPNGNDVQDLRHQINRTIDEEVTETASIPVSGMSRPATTYSSTGQPRPRQRRRLKLGRSKNHKISFELQGIFADIFIHPSGGGEIVSSVDVRLKDFEIFDKVPTSTWRKFLTHMTSDTRAREMSKPMFHIHVDNVKTLLTHSASEIRLYVSVLPLRLHVDQDALDFITRFFEFKDKTALTPDLEAEKPYIQRVEVETVDMCLDYKPKTLDYAGLRSGKTTELMNIIGLEAANIRLRHAIAYGVKSFEDLHPTLNDIWMADVKSTQLPTIIAGLAPFRNLANLGSGIRDVVTIPVREYKKDGRILRSIQKGAFQFGKTTTSELVRLGAKVALGTQTLLSNAEHSLRPPDRFRTNQGWVNTSDDSDIEEQRAAVSAYANQPLGLVAGLRSARRYLEHDLLTARDALIAVQGDFLESRGPGEMVGAIGRHAPTVILRPVIGGMRAVGTTLLGVGNAIDREGIRRVEDKYKPR